MAAPLRFYSPQASQLLLMVQQIRAYERLPSAEQTRLQQTQLFALLSHAWQHSPWWQARLKNAGFDPTAPTLDAFQHLPPLTRSDIQSSFAKLRARTPDMQEADIIVSTTSGSTGVPVQVEKDMRIYGQIYAAISWMEGLWHQRDARKKIAVLAVNVKDGSTSSWGGMYEVMDMHGPNVTRSLISGDMESHLAWLQAERPDYLKCSPMVASELAQLAIAKGITLPIRQIISQWERTTARHRELCLQAFGAVIIDRYSCEEAGWLALPCPSHQNLHVVSASVLLEIVDDTGLPCPPGKVGRVLITSLHSTAMPIIRYDIGDLAEWGEPCGCGMTLPVIKQLRGRIRHQVHRHDGSLLPMAFLGDELGVIKAIGEFRILQYTGNELEIQIKWASRPSDKDIQAIIKSFVDNGLGGLPLQIKSVAQIAWELGRKREEFTRLDIPLPR
ncbi:MAG: hypothetical protein V4751_05740 [Pseudomonadota bacterium]